MLIGNKKDLGDQREVTKEEAENFAMDIRVPFQEISCVYDNNDIWKFFEEIGNLYLFSHSTENLYINDYYLNVVEKSLINRNKKKKKKSKRSCIY